MAFAQVGAEIKSPPEMVHTVFGFTAKFTVWSHYYIQTRQICLYMDSFIFSILLKQQQNGLKTNQTEGVWSM
jgi:hypothetical protein